MGIKGKGVPVAEFVGQKFGKNLQVTVIERVDNQRNKAVFKVHCTECAKDPELFGEGVFFMTKGNLEKGCIPCGCGSYKYGQEQSLIRVNRKIVEKGFNLEVIGFASQWVGCDSKLVLKCNVHGTVWDSVGVHTFLSSRYNGMCIECEKECISSRNTVDEQLVIDKAISTGLFPEGSVFWRTPEKISADENGRLRGNTWAMICGICSHDKYVEAGLCSGIFSTLMSSLQDGHRPCRCSDKFNYTVDQRKLQIEEAIGEGGGKYQFAGFDRNNSWNHTSKIRFNVFCKDHGIFESNITAVRRGSVICRECSPAGGFKIGKPGSVYVLDVQGRSGSFTGYGISNVVEDRMKAHENELAKYGFKIMNKEIFSFSGRKALNIENKIFDKFELVSQEVSGFKTEATHHHLYHDVVDFVASHVTQHA